MKNIVVLTEAGISVEIGLGTFRDLGGLWGDIELKMLLIQKLLRKIHP